MDLVFGMIIGGIVAVVAMWVRGRRSPKFEVDTSQVRKAIEPVIDEELSIYKSFRDDISNLSTQVLGTLKELHNAMEVPFDVATAIEEARGVAWRMEVAANRAERFIHYVADASTDAAIRDRANAVLIDIKAIKAFANEQAMKAVLEKHPEWTPQENISRSDEPRGQNGRSKKPQA
jgi:hypothetical protein